MDFGQLPKTDQLLAELTVIARRSMLPKYYTDWWIANTRHILEPSATTPPPFPTEAHRAAVRWARSLRRRKRRKRRP